MGQEALKARSIPAWGNAPGFEAHRIEGLKARPIKQPSIHAYRFDGDTTVHNCFV